MPLINCIECGKEISDEESSCPNCGSPNKYGKKEDKKEKRKKRGNAKGIGCWFIFLSVILGFTVIGLPFAVFLGISGFVIIIIRLFL